MFRGEGTIKANLQEPNLLTLREQCSVGLFRSATARTHHDNDTLGVRCALVIEKVILPSRNRSELVHHLLNDCGRRVVEGVGSFSRLKEDIRVLRRAAPYGMVRRESALA